MKTAENRPPVKLKNLGGAEAGAGEAAGDAGYRFNDLNGARAAKASANLSFILDIPLEVTVWNLWPNRLIGDAALPPEERVAWTTWNPFRKGDRLPESGLIGPVTLRTAIAK